MGNEVTVDFMSTMTQQSFVPGANAAMINVLPAVVWYSEIVFDFVVVPPLE